MKASRLFEFPGPVVLSKVISKEFSERIGTAVSWVTELAQ